MFIVLLNFVLRYTLTTDSKYLTISVLRRSCDGTKDSTGMIVKYFKTVVNVKRRTKIGKTMKCSNSYMAQAYRLSKYARNPQRVMEAKRRIMTLKTIEMRREIK